MAIMVLHRCHVPCKVDGNWHCDRTMLCTEYANCCPPGHPCAAGRRPSPSMPSAACAPLPSQHVAPAGKMNALCSGACLLCACMHCCRGCRKRHGAVCAMYLCEALVLGGEPLVLRRQAALLVCERCVALLHGLSRMTTNRKIQNIAAPACRDKWSSCMQTTGCQQSPCGAPSAHPHLAGMLRIHRGSRSLQSRHTAVHSHCHCTLDDVSTWSG
jgi:hypothetical protein